MTALSGGDDWLAPLVEDLATVTVDRATIDLIATRLDIEVAQLERAVRGLVRSTVEPGSNPALDMRTDTWRIDIPTALAKSVLCGAVTAVLLQAIGADAIPPTVLALITPFLFEVERVEIDASDVVFHAALATAAAGGPTHLPDLYDRLPASVRNELSVTEFGDLIDRLVSLRLAKVGPQGVQLAQPGHHKGFRLLLR